jgi:hypothetical protein
MDGMSNIHGLGWSDARDPTSRREWHSFADCSTDARRATSTNPWMAVCGTMARKSLVVCVWLFH